jgi:hypothetical protein
VSAFDASTWLRLGRLVLTEPSRGRRKLFVCGLYLALTAQAAVSAFCLAADRFLFPRFRRIDPVRPIFIIGNGRSGTTHVHRLLTADRGRFTFFATWELLLPSILQKRIVHALAFLDRALLRGAVARGLARREDAALEEVRRLHDWQSSGSEEDDFLFFHNFSSVSLTWPFPYPELGYLFWTDRMPERHRRELVGWYRDLIRRQLYLHGAERTHCAKSPQFTLKMRTLCEVFPDARFIVMVRHPYETIPSLVDLMSWYWKRMGAPQPLIEGSANLLREVMVAQYRYALDVAEELPPERCAVVRFEDLLADPRAVVEGLYARFGIPLSPEFAVYLEGERQHARTFVSAHRYEPMADEAFRQRLLAELGDLFDRFGWERGPSACDPPARGTI